MIDIPENQKKIFITFKIKDKKNGTEKITKSASLVQKKIINKENKKNESSKIPINQSSFKEKPIGTTIISLLNKENEILNILECYIEIFNSQKYNEIQNLPSKISELVNDFNLKERDLNAILDTIYELNEGYDTKDDTMKDDIMKYYILQDIKNNTDSNIITQAENILDKIRIYENEYVKEYDLISLLEIIIEDNCCEEYWLKYILLNICKKLEKDLMKLLNDTLKILVKIIFNNFYNDIEMINKLQINFGKEQGIYEFQRHIQQKYENDLNNTFYEYINNYLLKIEDESIEKINEMKKKQKYPIKKNKFDEFSYKEITILFIKSLISNINFIKDNFDKEIDIKNMPVVYFKESSSTYSISSLKELFILTKNYLNENKTFIKKCDICNRYFISQNHLKEKYCNNIYKGKLTCKEYAKSNYRKYNPDIYNKICSMLRNRDKRNNTNELVCFQGDYNTFLEKNPIHKEKEEWLEEYHKRTKKRNYTKRGGKYDY